MQVRVPMGEDVEVVQRRLAELLAELRHEPGLEQLVSWGPIPVRVQAEGGEIVLMVAAETRPSRREEVERELRGRIRKRFLPMPHQVAVAEP